ncbi:indole-3-glycerol phosphate synthase TrpC [Streptococcaceae bacterium ESL0729]|nr:indole-3-glycerol phosphate synthase TrpC [Streptococcaceae bacterium ESL0729]
MEFLEEILAYKKAEVEAMDELEAQGVRKTYRLIDHLKENQGKLGIIAEVKKASPSLGAINMDVDILEQAKSYEGAGAMAISVLTDEHYFKGKLDYLREISAAVNIPTLNKDFIIDKRQINRAVNAGATIILLIVAALPKNRLEELFTYAESLGLEVLLEVHDLEELEIAHDLGAQLIGINNRNLKTFEVSLATSHNLAPYFKEDCFYISESGIRTAADSHSLAKNFNGLLVGETLMRAENPAIKLQEIGVSRL